MTLEIQQTEVFADWHREMRDQRAKIAIARRIERAAQGNLGDVRTLREGLSEMRVDVGAGYRLYFTVRGQTIVLLLCGGDKSSQDADIERGIRMLKEL